MSNKHSDEERELNFHQFKKFFFMQFTRQLIRNSAPAEISAVQIALEKEQMNRIENTRRKIQEKIKTKERELLGTPVSIEKKRTEEMQSIVHPRIGMFDSQEKPHLNPFKQNYKKVRLAIPESKLPIHLQYVKPVPINLEFDLGQLNPLLKDPMIRSVECHGAGENIIVQGNMGTKKTGIILSKEEIEDIIDKFSKETKIPAGEGIFKVVAGKLIFMAIISQIVGSKFIIKKMLNNPNTSQQLPSRM